MVEPATSQQLPERLGRAAADRRTGLGRAGHRACGSALRVTLVLGPHDSIESLSVDAIGHGVVAEASRLPELFVGKRVAEALAITHRDLARMLGGLPESRMYCSVLLHEALRAALADARGELREDAGDALTCRCFAVRENMLRRAIRMNQLTSVEEVTCYTKAGGGCGVCASSLAGVISSVHAEIQAEDAEPPSGTRLAVCGDFRRGGAHPELESPT